MKCHNCSKPAMYFYGSQQVPLCLDCYGKAVDIEKDQRPRGGTTIIQKPTITFGGPSRSNRSKVTYNNINISQSIIGVINSRNLKMVDSAITTLKKDPSAHEVSAAISQLANAIAQSTDLTPEKKNEAVEILGTVASEAVAPKEKRRNVVIKTLMNAIPTAIQTAASVMQIWQQVEPVIKGYFQI